MEINEEKLVPFIKWVGGKRNVIKNYLHSYFPLSYETYIEPFVGGGSFILFKT